MAVARFYNQVMRECLGGLVRATQRFECLNMLGFQRHLACRCVLAIHPDDFFLFGRTQNERGKMAAKRQVSMGYKSSKFVISKQDSVDM